MATDLLARNVTKDDIGARQAVVDEEDKEVPYVLLSV